MTKRSLIIGLVVIGAIATVGCFGKFKNMPDRMFSKFDEDKDGFVDKTEYFAISESRFKRNDDNDDNKVSMKESKDNFIAKRFPEKMDKWFNESDLDHDGFVSHMEMRKKSKNEFFAQDVNTDGKLSKKEMKDYKTSQRFKSADTNNDGSISKEEFANIKSPFRKK